MFSSRGPHHHAGPLVREGLEDLARFTSLSGVGAAQWVRFEHSICWIREASVSISFSHGEALLKEGPRFCDHRGFLSGLDAGVQEATRLCGVYEVTSESSLTVAVEVSIADMPRLRAARPSCGIASGGYYYEPESRDGAWFHYDADAMAVHAQAQGMEARFEALEALRRLGPVAVVEPVEIWSSKLDIGPGGPRQMLADFLSEQRGAVVELVATQQDGRVTANPA